ncbi:pentapeptide repeat-containing protein [Aquibium carbonis]|uniref:Pentapeptide repeat-containing protein n=2 Tax=Aquibium carbonis TaxID=2495581 RepID=A0A3R9Y921_9HYPH|nr:pentapeptide repeat-containing protein [Aquibium carbonis]
MPTPDARTSGRLPGACDVRKHLGLAALASGLAMAVSALSGVAALAADCRSQAAPGVDWQDCTKSNIVIRGANLANANLTGTDLTMTDLRSTTLTGAKLQKATLVRSSLAGANAAGADFSRVEAYRTSFSGIIAPGSAFSSAELQRADFTGAELTNAIFEKAELGRANFNGASIGGAKFDYANLSRAQFTGAVLNAPIDFTGAFMFLTRIEGVDLSAATGLAQAQIDLACGDANTRLPGDLAASPSWPCTFD